MKTPEEIKQEKAKAWKRSLVDCLLRSMAAINCNTGIDSSPEEKAETNAELKKLEGMIKEIDPEYFEKIKQDEIK